MVHSPSVRDDIAALHCIPSMTITPSTDAFVIPLIGNSYSPVYVSSNDDSGLMTGLVLSNCEASVESTSSRNILRCAVSTVPPSSKYNGVHSSEFEWT